jgi:trans-L-3-hydroxyproline dehydratase
MINLLEGWGWQAPSHWPKVQTLEMHTGGEPLRIFLAGLPELPGKTILEKRAYFRDHHDRIRTGILWEPRGHADMYAAILTDPTKEGADFGVFFLHNEGYSSMCGHAIIALTTLAYETGLVSRDKPEIVIEAPAGEIIAFPHFRGGKLESVSFHNVPSFVYLNKREIHIDGIGKLKFDIAYGGAFYAIVEAGEIGLELTIAEAGRCIDLGRRIKQSIMQAFEIKHPAEDELGFLYGTIFTGKAQDPANHSRNVCIFADGELDRSATGTGVSARAALHHARNELAMDQKISIESILGTTMDVMVKKEIQYGPYRAVIPEVTGKAHITGKSTFYFDPDDPLKEGFIIR